MIICKENTVKIEGTTVEVLAEFCGIIQSMKSHLEKLTDEKFAREQIALAGRLAFASDEELKQIQKDMRKELEEMIERRIR